MQPQTDARVPPPLRAPEPVDIIALLQAVDTIRLDISEFARIARPKQTEFCTPKDYPAVMTLSRISVTPDMKLKIKESELPSHTDGNGKSFDKCGAKPSDGTAATQPPTIVIRQAPTRSSRPGDYNDPRLGPAFDIFDGTLRVSGVEYPGLMVKVVDLRCLPEAGRIPTKESVTADLAEEVHSFTVAAAAQGLCLPRLAGLFRYCTNMYCMVFDDAGRELINWYSDPNNEVGTQSLRDELAAALTIIHNAGVLPSFNDNSMDRVIRRGRDGRIKFCNLYEADRRDMLTSDRLQKIHGHRTIDEGLADDTWMSFREPSIEALLMEFS